MAGCQREEINNQTQEDEDLPDGEESGNGFHKLLALFVAENISPAPAATGEWSGHSSSVFHK